MFVNEPWPPSLILPLQTSTVEIHCTSKTESRALWSVDLGSDSSGLQFRTGIVQDQQILADFGVFELPPIESAREQPTLRLLINDTARNNLTRVICGSEQSTTLLLFGTACLLMIVTDSIIDSAA